MMTRKLNSILLASVMAVATTSAALAQPASELLEKGIFTEETVGDLDKAIGIYQQILDDAESNRKLAASAQFRLASCYLKKGQDAEATEAFEALITNYPDQKELIARAREVMPGQLVVGPVTWGDGEVMRLDMSLPTGMRIGMFAWSADKIVTDAGQDAWQMKTRRYIALNGTHGVSGVIAEPESFRPMSSWFNHTVLGNTSAAYTPAEVKISHIGQGMEDTTIGFDGPVFDNEQAVYLIRRLPLAVGYKTTLPIMITFGGKQMQIPLTVLEKQTITVPAGEFECYKVDLVLEKIMHQTMWFSTDDAHLLVKLSADGIIGELASVAKQGSGKPVEYKDAKFGFTLSMPSGWCGYQTDQDNPTESGVHLIDPDATAINHLDVDTIESLGLEASQPVREMLEPHLDKMSQHRASLSIREDSWVERTVGGRPAVSVIVEFVDQGKPMAVYIVAVAGETTFTKLKSATTPDKLEKAKAQIDQIIATYKAK